jgi:hypothetical protein
MIFGRKPYVVAGKNAFFDFLQSVADAELVMRAGEAIPTRSFLDSMSETISCLMVTYSPHFGICSTIEITATFGSDVQVDFTVKHIQSSGRNREVFPKDLRAASFTNWCPFQPQYGPEVLADVVPAGKSGRAPIKGSSSLPAGRPAQLTCVDAGALAMLFRCHVS